MTSAPLPALDRAPQEEILRDCRTCRFKVIRITKEGGLVGNCHAPNGPRGSSGMDAIDAWIDRNCMCMGDDSGLLVAEPDGPCPGWERSC